MADSTTSSGSRPISAQAARIPGLDDRQRAAVEQAIRRTVRKIVHTPTVRAKEACARGDENLLQAARWLFGIDGREEDAVAGVEEDAVGGSADRVPAEGVAR